ncbi:MAG: hypothetical protein OXF01_16245 [Gemmatimonadetes bacterium]|nr:hypothetical protein [Gemmatimonadota bacterium]
MSGKAHPSPRVRRRLQHVLGVTDFDDLFTITDEERRHPCARRDRYRPRGGGGNQRPSDTRKSPHT